MAKENWVDKIKYKLPEMNKLKKDEKMIRYESPYLFGVFSEKRHIL